VSAMSQSAQVNDLVRRDNKSRPISSEDFFLGAFPLSPNAAAIRASTRGKAHGSEFLK